MDPKLLNDTFTFKKIARKKFGFYVSFPVEFTQSQCFLERAFQLTNILLQVNETNIVLLSILDLYKQSKKCNCSAIWRESFN